MTNNEMENLIEDVSFIVHDLTRKAYAKIDEYLKDIDNKLIIVEGLPCTRKSTTSKHITDFLKQSGEKTIYVDEGTGNHPADYEFHAYISEKSMAILQKDMQEKIKKYAEKAQNGLCRWKII